jgi:hypothetical protein
MEEEIVYVDENNNPVSPPSGRTNQQSNNYPPITSNRLDKGDILDKIKPDLIVEVIRHKLMGEESINGNWVKIMELQERALSQTGAWDLSNLMLGASSQNVALSKLTNEEIRARSLSIAITAQKMCLKNWKQYGIKGTDQLDFVHQIVFTNTFITLKQPQDGGIRDLIKGTTSEQRQVVSQEDNRRGFFRRR